MGCYFISNDVTRILIIMMQLLRHYTLALINALEKCIGTFYQRVAPDLAATGCRMSRLTGARAAARVLRESGGFQLIY